MVRSLISVILFYTLMMEVKDVGEICDKVLIQTQCDLGYVETFPLWFGDASYIFLVNTHIHYNTFEPNVPIIVPTIKHYQAQ